MATQDPLRVPVNDVLPQAIYFPVLFIYAAVFCFLLLVYEYARCRSIPRLYGTSTVFLTFLGKDV